MNHQKQVAAGFPLRVEGGCGLGMEFNSNGSIRRIDHGDILINLFLGNEIEGGPARLFLRRHGAAPAAIPLAGPGSPARHGFDERGMWFAGERDGLRFRGRVTLAATAPAWFWHVELENTGATAVTCDLIHAQDVGLAHYGAVRLNEYYVSQYLDHSPLAHPRVGWAVASRQNQSMGGRCPWLVLGSLGRGTAFATDALQFHGLATRAGHAPPGLTSGLPGKRLQHEHSLVAIQDEPVTLAPGGVCQRGFFGWFEPDHPAATGAADVARVDAALALPEAQAPVWPEEAAGTRAAESWFAPAVLLETVDLGEEELRARHGTSPRHEERAEDGRLLGFFTERCRHVVLRAKELRVLRPHGHLLRSGNALVPDESALTSTVWMNGVFHSMVTQGHVSINRLLSTCHSYLGLFRSHGQRVFAEIDGRWQLLDTPSAFEMEPACCRWIYRHRGGTIEVTAAASGERHQLVLEIEVTAGPATRFLVSHHVALHGDDGSGSLPVTCEPDGAGWLLRAAADSDVGRRFPSGTFRIAPAAGTVIEAVGGDELLFADGVSRRQPFFCLVTAPARTAGLTIEGRLTPPQPLEPSVARNATDGHLLITPPATAPLAAAAARTAEIFPWFVDNALVHYLSPRGLEQYSGGGWGTRDVCQGPVELLLALGRFEPIRDLLCRVFRQQNPDGDWPQWFMFFERERNIRPGDSHGDIVYWPLLALAQYLTATGDAGLLEARLPYFHPEGAGETESVRDHVRRALDLIARRVVAGTRLAAYGHGDWNDSLQPAKPEMREQLCSAWTVTLNLQTFRVLAAALRQAGDPDEAARLEAAAAAILDEFRRLLVVDGVVCGLACFPPGGATGHLLHPRDRVTGLSYSLLPMIHAILNDMFTPQEAATHLELIRRHLSGPDGARLFDRPLPYRGGPQEIFQRAESASYFGREIGLMYTHAHLRHAEALARFGDADGFFRALCQANPVGMRELVPCAAPRQSNCYYSSSDAAFADRHEAFAEYGKVARGEIALEGGWRVYSSGAGIAARLIVQCFLGLRLEGPWLVVDPVIPRSLDGLRVELSLAGELLEVIYQIGSKGCGPQEISLDGRRLDFTRDANPYRPGAARVAWHEVRATPRGGIHRLQVRLG